MIMTTKLYSGTCGLKTSWHLSYGWGKPPKKPHPKNLSRPGIEPGPSPWQMRMLRTVCSTAIIYVIFTEYKLWGLFSVIRFIWGYVILFSRKWSAIKKVWEPLRLSIKTVFWVNHKAYHIWGIHFQRVPCPKNKIVGKTPIRFLTWDKNHVQRKSKCKGFGMFWCCKTK